MLYVVMIAVLISIIAALVLTKQSHIRCRKCNGTNVSSDPYKFRGVICHLCNDCGEVYETLRNTR